MSLVRAGLDELLRRHPLLDLVSIDWQVEQLPPEVINPEWVFVELGKPSEDFERTPVWARSRFAIWKRTGAVYRRDPDGAISDDPLFEPSRGIPNLPIETTYSLVVGVLREMADLIEKGDSFEGSLEYLLPDVPDWAMRGEPEPEDWKAPEVLLKAAYRIGNRMGQGGYRIIGR